MTGMVACGLMNRLSPRRAARRTAASLLAAIQIGGYGCCSGRQVAVTFDKLADVVFKADAVLGPQPLDDFETLLEAAHALAARHAERIELDLAIAEADAKYEIAAPDRVERGDAFGDLDRVVQGRQQHPGDAGHLARLGREPRQKRDQLQLAHALAQVMLAGGDGVPAAVARQPGHRILAFELGDDVAAGRVLAGQKDPDLHDFSDADAPIPGFARSTARMLKQPAVPRAGATHPSARSSGECDNASRI